MITFPFSALPGAPGLFSDYCSRTSDAGNYFIGHFSDMMAYETHFQILERRKYSRETIYEILAEQNKRFFSGDRSLANIERFRNPNCYAVVTGQQVGLFTGPLYTIYKALTAVQTAIWLREQFPAYDFIPIFWLESEDHDFLEANNTAVINRDNQLTRLTYAQPEEDAPRNQTPVGSMVFDERITDTIAALAAALPETEFTPELLKMLHSCYAPGTTFATAFARLLNSLLKDSGLVFLDPDHPGLKHLLAPAILQELETFPVTGEEVIKRSAELEEQYHAQIKPRAVNLFFLRKGGRYPIEPSEYGFFLRGSRQRFTRDELLEIANANPERFSPSVLLRPVFQDFLLPTAAYVGGPAEVSYFAQLQPAYDHFHIPMPVILPRASMTIIETKIAKVFHKYGLPYEAMFNTADDAYKMATLSTSGVEDRLDFEAIRRDVMDIMNVLPGLSSEEDANLADPAGNTLRSIEHALKSFEEKLFRSRRQRDEVSSTQIGKLLAYLSPEGKPQERQIGVLTFVNRYGPEICSTIEKTSLPFPAEHRLLLL